MKKTIFITGAAKRIGKEIALCFSEMGWNGLSSLSAKNWEVSSLSYKKNQKL